MGYELQGLEGVPNHAICHVAAPEPMHFALAPPHGQKPIWPAPVKAGGTQEVKKKPTR